MADTIWDLDRIRFQNAPRNSFPGEAMFLVRADGVFTSEVKCVEVLVGNIRDLTKMKEAIKEIFQSPLLAGKQTKYVTFEFPSCFAQFIVQVMLYYPSTPYKVGIKIMDNFSDFEFDEFKTLQRLYDYLVEASPGAVVYAARNFTGRLSKRTQNFVRHISVLILKSGSSFVLFGRGNYIPVLKLSLKSSYSRLMKAYISHRLLIGCFEFLCSFRSGPQYIISHFRSTGLSEKQSRILPACLKYWPTDEFALDVRSVKRILVDEPPFSTDMKVLCVYIERGKKRSKIASTVEEVASTFFKTFL